MARSLVTIFRVKNSQKDSDQESLISNTALGKSIRAFYNECCGSGYRTNCFFDPWICIGFFRISDPGSPTHISE